MDAANDRARARALLSELILSDECRVERFDASYLDDLHDILREMHGITKFHGNSSPAQAKVRDLAQLAGIPLDSPITELAPALRRIGISDEEFSPKRSDDPDLLDQWRLSRQPSWQKLRDRGVEHGKHAARVRLRTVIVTLESRTAKDAACGSE